MPRLEAKVIVTLEELSLLREAWTTLLKTTEGDNIFLTWEWVYIWCKYYLGNGQLCTVLFYDDEKRLVGIAPFYIHSSRIFGVLSFKEMRFLGIEEVCPAYLDFIASDKYRRAVVEAFYERIFGEWRSKWNVLVLSELPAESLSIDYLTELAEHDGKVFQVADPIPSPIITLPKHVDEFLASIGRNERYNLQRKRKRLDRAGVVSWERITALPDFSKAMDSFVWLHQTRWEGKGEAGAFKRSRFEAFHQEIGKLFAEQQWSSIDLLKLDGEPIAGIYGYRYNGRYSYYLPGFNHNVLPEASPGTLLLFHCVEQAIASGISEFDLLRGAMPYKLAWASALRRCLTLRIYNRHLSSGVSMMYGSARDFWKILLR